MKLLSLILLPLLLATGLKAEPPRPKADASALRHFRKACARLARKASLMSVMGADGWLLMDNELEHLAAGEFWGKAARIKGRARRASKRDPLPVLIDTQRQFKELGLRLILMPIPAKAIIYPESVWPDSPKDARGVFLRLDPDHQRFYALLREHGLEVLDYTELLLAERQTASAPLYCKHDTHFSGRAARLLAGALAPQLKDIPKNPRLQLERQERPLQITGDLYQTWRLQIPKSRRPEPEILDLSFVGQRNKNGTLVPLAEDRDSPLLIFGDSHGLIFHAGDDMHAEGAGLPDQLAFELGRAVDIACVRGESATGARLMLRGRQKKDPNYLRSKKIAIWVFSVRELTDGDWMKVPLVSKPKNANRVQPTPTR